MHQYVDKNIAKDDHRIVGAEYIYIYIYIHIYIYIYPLQ